MILRVKEVPPNINPQIIAKFRFLVSKKRWDKAMSYKRLIDQYLCLESYKILADIINEEYGFSEALDFHYNEYGKPRLELDKEIYFNISHCEKAIAVAVFHKEVGVDVECINPITSDLINYCCNEREMLLIEESQTPDLLFTILWTQKESFYKLKGKGIDENIKNILTVEDSNNIRFNTKVSSNGSYVVTTCIEE